MNKSKYRTVGREKYCLFNYIFGFSKYHSFFKRKGQNGHHGPREGFGFGPIYMI